MQSDMWFDLAVLACDRDCSPLSRAFPAPAFGNRWLDYNQLTSLEVGVFDKNTALLGLYVDPKQRGEGV